MARPVRSWARSLRCLASSTGRVDGDERRAHPVEPAACLDDGVVDLVRVGHRQAAAGVRPEGIAEEIGDVDHRRHELGGVEDPPQRAGHA